MTTTIICVSAFLVCAWAGNRSLRHGLLAVLVVGYGYGILRANVPDTWTFATFDAAVLGLYTAQLWRGVDFEHRLRTQSLRLWLVLLIGWPTLLFFVFAPSEGRLVELVGLRGNVFVLPFIYLGARLDAEDLSWLSLRVAALNLCVVGIGILQFSVGIEAFFPRNEVTTLIYRSKDLAEQTAYRIPATFSSAHVFAGTLVMTLPLLFGAWVQRHEERRWHAHLLLAAAGASLIGIFMAATRTHMVSAAAVIGAVTLWGRLGTRKKLRWAVVVAMIGYIVAGEERLQRFTTLQDTDFVSERLTGSVNSEFFDLMVSYPLGNGLEGGGTSVPYFLQESASQMVLENEYARIALEQGIPGLVSWLVFVLWALVPWPRITGDPWSVGRRLSWVIVTASFLFGLTGIGMFAAMPQAPIMFLLMGWFVGARCGRRPASAFVPSVRRAHVSPDVAAAPVGSLQSSTTGSSPVRY